jgi:hypothetical protein
LADHQVVVWTQHFQVLSKTDTQFNFYASLDCLPANIATDLTINNLNFVVFLFEMPKMASCTESEKAGGPHQKSPPT